jgi:hypothetical protein
VVFEGPPAALDRPALGVIYGGAGEELEGALA